MTYRNGHNLPPSKARSEIPPDRLALISSEVIAGIPLAGAAEARLPELARKIRVHLQSIGALPQERRTMRRLRLARPRMPRIVPLRPSLGYGAIAACVLVLVAIGITLDNNTINAPYGNQLTQTLSDGTTLTLNAGTKVRVARDYNGDSRTVKLMRGEVMFDVTESAVPFVVSTDHGIVEVLGTTFGVRSWPTDAENYTAVAVTSGHVRVTARAGEAHVLEAGDAARLSGRGFTSVDRMTSEVEHQVSWVDKDFKFSDHLTGDILEELERRYDIDITVEVENLEKTRSGILLESPSGPERILEDLCELHDCRFIANPDGRFFRIVPR